MEERKYFEDTVINNTRFIFQRNFAGDPAKSGKYPSTARKVNIVINDMQLVKKMTDMGYNVKCYNPAPDSEEPEIMYFVDAELKYRDKFGEAIKYPPKAYMVSGDNVVALDEESVDILDTIRVSNVDVVIHPSQKDDGGLKAYIKVIYVTKVPDDDPFAEKYGRTE